MPDIGLFELILIGAVAFLVLGPERLPEFFAQIARTVRRARGWAAEMKQQIKAETEPLHSPATEMRDIIDAGLSTAAATEEKPVAEKPAKRKPAARKPRSTTTTPLETGEAKPAARKRTPRKIAPQKKAEPKKTTPKSDSGKSE